MVMFNDINGDCDFIEDCDIDAYDDGDQALSQLLQAGPAPLRADEEALLLFLKTSLIRNRLLLGVRQDGRQDGTLTCFSKEWRWLIAQ